jgi:hypothetical protein
MRLVLGALVDLVEFYARVGCQPIVRMLRHEHQRLERALTRSAGDKRSYRRLTSRVSRPNPKRNVVIAFPDRAFGVAADWYEKSDPRISDLLAHHAAALATVRLHKTSEIGRRTDGHSRKYVRRHTAQAALGIPEGEVVPAKSYELQAG